MDHKRNVILSHTVEDRNWGFCRVLSASSGFDFEVEYMSIGSGGNRFRNILCYLLFPIQIFWRRKEYNIIVANQQFYGLLLAFYCRLFHVTKTFRLVIVSFIYKPKQGVIGKIYKQFIRYICNSNYIDKYIVRSSHELDTYREELNIDPEKLKFVPLGLGGNFESQYNQEMLDRKYILSVGRSNRDYPFLISALEQTEYNVDIICDNLHMTSTNPHIHIHNDIFKELPLWVKNCYCVVIPLADTNVSSGQLVLLHAMMEGKPIIITRAKAILDYICPNETGICIDNTSEQLLEALNRLYTDQTLYKRLSENERREFETRFSAEKAVEAIGEIIKEIA